MKYTWRALPTFTRYFQYTEEDSSFILLLLQKYSSWHYFTRELSLICWRLRHLINIIEWNLVNLTQLFIPTWKRKISLHKHCYCALFFDEARADKGWAVKRARTSKKVWCSGLGLCLEMSPVLTSVRACDVVCPFNRHCRCHWIMAPWSVFLHNSSPFLCAGTLSSRGKCCYFLRKV